MRQRSVLPYSQSAPKLEEITTLPRAGFQNTIGTFEDTEDGGLLFTSDVSGGGNGFVYGETIQRYDATDTTFVWKVDTPNPLIGPSIQLWNPITHKTTWAEISYLPQLGTSRLQVVSTENESVDDFVWNRTSGWIRYREQDGEIHWEFSGDGFEWEEILSFDTPANFSYVEVEVYQYDGHDVGERTGGTSKLSRWNNPPVPSVGDGGVGHSWFVVELTSEHVEPPPGPDRPPFVPIPGPGVHRPRRQRFEDRFPGRYRVVKSIEQRFPGRVITTSRFAGRFKVVESGAQTFSATFRTSTLRATRREEEEFVLLMMDE